MAKTRVVSKPLEAPILSSCLVSLMKSFKALLQAKTMQTHGSKTMYKTTEMSISDTLQLATK